MLLGHSCGLLLQISRLKRSAAVNTSCRESLSICRSFCVLISILVLVFLDEVV